MTNSTHDLTPPEAIPYPARAPRWVHDIIEIDKEIASTQKPDKKRTKTRTGTKHRKGKLCQQ